MQLFTIKRLFILCAVIACFAIIINILAGNISEKDDEYISPSADKIRYSDIKDYMSRVDFSTGNSGDLFKSGLVNKYTLKYFKHLQSKFKDMEYNDHIEAVRKYLYSVMDSADADKFIELYKKYVEYENRAAVEVNQAGELKTADDYLVLLRKMKLLQIEIFGKDDAAAIFGTVMKLQEYPVRRGGIVNDESLYASDKLKLLDKLNTDMWGDEGREVENSRKPYVAYTETMSIYSKDFSEMNDSDRSRKVEEIRKNIFPPDVVKRLEEVDSQISSEKIRDSEYEKEYNSLIHNNEITADEKNRLIRNLQDRIYGDDADSVRRREEIIKGKEDFKKNLNIN